MTHSDEDDGRVPISAATWDKLLAALGRLARGMAIVADQAQRHHQVKTSDIRAMGRVAGELDAALDEARLATGAPTGPPVVH